jgi:hypothetical protein
MNYSEPPKRYEVRLGHSFVTVEGHDAHEAIQQARRALCLDMPRLFDVIQSCAADQFRVNPVDERNWT